MSYSIDRSSCRARQIDGDPEKVVCVCDESSSCDDLEFSWPNEKGQTISIISSRGGKRFEVSEAERDLSECLKRDITSVRVSVNITSKLQPIMGWGGAFTDAAGSHLAKMREPLADKILASLFGPNGLQYNFARVPIAGLDFSERPYSYDDTIKNEPDLELHKWSLTKEDHVYKIPFIKKALRLTHGDLKIFGSPWSPPAWMKTSKSFVRGHLIDTDDVYKAYANYLIKFFDAYESEGIKFWGATIQNEPISAFLPFYWFNSLQMSAKETIKFVSKYYGPALEASNRTKENFKLMIGDDNLGFLNFQTPSVMADQDTAKYISGLAFHWYSSGVVPYDHLNSLYEHIKDKINFVLMTEACTGSKPTSRGPRLGDWSRGEMYASDIIEDLNRHTNGWIDFNLVLDLEGHPNWAKNYVDSSIIVDIEKGEFYKQPMYYALAHFSRLMRPGSRIVSTKFLQQSKGLSMVGAIKEDTGHLIVNILNSSNQPRKVHIAVSPDQGYSIGPIIVDEKSVTSIVTKL